MISKVEWDGPAHIELDFHEQNYPVNINDHSIQLNEAELGKLIADLQDAQRLLNSMKEDNHEI